MTFFVSVRNGNPKCFKIKKHKSDNAFSPFSTRRNFPRGATFSFVLKTNWRRVDVKRQKKISFRAENSAWWKTAVTDILYESDVKDDCSNRPSGVIF